jgi:hypothetical protein
MSGHRSPSDLDAAAVAAGTPSVADSAAEILSRAERLVGDVLSDVAGVEAQVDDDGVAIAEISRDLASVHAQLAQIKTGIIALQTHSLRQTGGVALTLSVLLAIAWKVLGG